MQKWFDGYDGPIDFSVHSLNIDAEENLGFCSFLYHVGGTLKAGGQVDMWVRATLCCCKIDGNWRILQVRRRSGEWQTHGRIRHRELKGAVGSGSFKADPASSITLDLTRGATP